MEVKEWYQNREDMLELKHINKVTGLIIDYFKPGHPQALRGEWTPLPGQPAPPAGPYTLPESPHGTGVWWEEPVSVWRQGSLGGK